MDILRLTSHSDWIEARQCLPLGHRIGFVPTMGALHAGHMALVEQARQTCDFVVASIFVNPTQFNQSDDFAAYPSDLENDLLALQSAGCSAAYCPHLSEVYPDGAKSRNMDLGGLDTVLEGALRPGHFQGVATVVDRLFDLIQPDVAFFGQKDYQQIKVIERVSALRGDQPQIVACPIVREAHGLAMSSRNRRLSPFQREAAGVIFAALRFAEEELRIFPVPPRALKLEMRRMIEESGVLQLESIDFALANSLLPIMDGEAYLDRYPEPVQAFVSAYAGEVRLIDTHRIVAQGNAPALEA